MSPLEPGSGIPTPYALHALHPWRRKHRRATQGTSSIIPNPEVCSRGRTGPDPEGGRRAGLAWGAEGVGFGPTARHARNSR